MREVRCGAQLWLRRSRWPVFRRRGGARHSGQRAGAPGACAAGIRLRPDQPRTSHKPGPSGSSVSGPSGPQYKGRTAPQYPGRQAPNYAAPRPSIRRLPIAGTQAHLMMARLVLGPATPVRRLRDTLATGSISIAECRCRIRSGCCATIPASTGFLPATSSG
jgi:hypothetical protein